MPDVAVFLWGRSPREANGAIANPVSVAPDWTIEILSPDQNQTEVTKHMLHCRQHGTQMGWLIAPEAHTVFVYRPRRAPEVLDAPDDLIPAPSFASALQLTIHALFAWLLE